VLGDRDTHRSTILTSFDARRRVLLARQEQPPAGIGGIAFATVLTEGAADAISHTTDAMAFLGPGGNPARPAAVEQGVRLDGQTGAGLEPSFVWRIDLEIPPGETRRCAFVLGDCEDLDELDSLLAGLRAPGAVERLADEVRDHWAERVDRVQIQTPIEAIDLMVNGWLAYQTLTCRLWGRTAFYQSGGAFGFRDQLQDASAFLATDPDLVRRQILMHAAHQFPEGDVLHWWHPPLSQGIRTRFADDLLWLPEATANYVRVTGDRAVLDESVGFVTAPPLAPGADEAFVTPGHDPAATDLYDHCCRAIDRSLATGAHGLPYFGTGDWNDGMNRVGREGRGESVWMAFFLYFVLDLFIPLCETRADHARVARYREHQERLQTSIESAGWDGAWYRRGYYDDGSPLGSSSSDECRIDALVQAWSVLSGAAPRARAEQSMNSALRQLVSEPARIVKLLAPAFDRTPRDPGYIKGYVPGVRENGGQYTHAALWVVRALAQLGRIDEAASMLEMLSPVSHGRTPGEVATYQVEPYVVAADVYGEPPHVGRGGWTWYTGSAGWMFRVALESILGISVEAGRSLVVRPRLPSSWPAFSLNVNPMGGKTVYAINVQRDDTGRGEIRASLDQQPIPVQDGTVSVALGGMTLRRELRISIPTSATRLKNSQLHS
jgi:cyclic beta-1,2-glucan synthetase